MKKMFVILVMMIGFSWTNYVFAHNVNGDFSGYDSIKMVKLYDMSDYQFAYIGNIRTMKLHVPGCRFAARTDYQNLIGFGSRKSAIKLGFVPCGVCKP